jgi:hypothetical protein
MSLISRLSGADAIIRGLHLVDEQVQQNLMRGLTEFSVSVRQVDFPLRSNLNFVTDSVVQRLQEAGLSVTGVDYQPSSGIAWVKIKVTGPHDMGQSYAGRPGNPPAPSMDAAYQVIWQEFLLGSSHEDAVDQALINIDNSLALVFAVIDEDRSVQFWDGQGITDQGSFENRTPEPGEYEVSWLMETSAFSASEAALTAGRTLVDPNEQITFVVCDSAGIKKVVFAYAA